MSLLKLLSTKGFISYNKTVARKLGVHEAILLGELCSIGDMYNYNEFYFERSKIINDTALSDSQIRNATKTLVEYGLVDVIKKGIPCKFYYTLNEAKILELFTSSDSKIEELLSAPEIEALEMQELQDKSLKNETTFNNKNTNKNINKNTISADAQKAKTNNQLFATETKPKKAKENKYVEIINDLSSNEQIKNALLGYCNFRRTRGLTAQQWRAMLVKFKNDSKEKSVDEILKCIEQCLINGRNSLYYSEGYIQNKKNAPPAAIDDSGPSVIRRRKD